VKAYYEKRMVVSLFRGVRRRDEEEMNEREVTVALKMYEAWPDKKKAVECFDSYGSEYE
jgi:hypothetical protein